MQSSDGTDLLLLQIFSELDQAGSLLAKETLEDGLLMHNGKGDVRKCPYYIAKQDKGRSYLFQGPLPGQVYWCPSLMPCPLLVLPCRCPGGQQLPLPNSHVCAEQAQSSHHSSHLCGPGCWSLGLVLCVKDPSQHVGALLPK